MSGGADECGRDVQRRRGLGRGQEYVACIPACVVAVLAVHVAAFRTALPASEYSQPPAMKSFTPWISVLAGMGLRTHSAGYGVAEHVPVNSCVLQH